MRRKLMGSPGQPMTITRGKLRDRGTFLWNENVSAWATANANAMIVLSVTTCRARRTIGD